MLRSASRDVSRDNAIVVWDPGVRLFHWLLAVAVATAAVTGFLAGATWLAIHVAAGLAASALVLARIVWGFTGTAHARFAAFLPRPHDILAHLRRDRVRHLGHNPLGALMVLVLVAAVLALAATGLVILGAALKTGPLAPDFGFEIGARLRGVHEWLAVGLLALVALHVGGVAFESRRSRENLALSMVTGRKQTRPGDHVVRPRRARAGIAAATIAVLGGGLYAGNAVLSSRPVQGLPVATPLPAYEAECTACHMAYHPSLLPAAAWSATMAGLESHFGENAALDPTTAAEIAAWLVANAAETADTKPAHRIGRTAPAGVSSLTDTPFWKRKHAGLSDAVFRRRTVRSRANCAACHADAAGGLFSPFAISVPKETSP